MAKILASVCILALLAIAPIYSQVTFTDVAESAGIRDIIFPWLFFGDYDNDGYVDMIACDFASPPARKLYHNERNGTFRNVSDTAGVFGGGPNGATFLDFDNDGYLDIFMSGNNSLEHGDRLLRNNGDGTFIDVSQKSGLYSEVRAQTGIQPMDSFVFDYDNDGLLDIFVSNLYSIPAIANCLYHNEGNGQFKDIAAQIGLDNPRIGGVSPGDCDNDGDLDIYIAIMGSIFSKPDPNDQGIDLFYRNEGNGVFVDIAKEAGIQRNANHLSGNFFDYNNDGYLDLFLNAVDYGDVYGFNILYKNNGNGTFSDVTKQAGILPIENGVTCMNYGDYDNDGWLDLCVNPIAGGGAFPVLIYHNNKDGTFTEVSNHLGISPEDGAAGVFVDYENDGDLDIMVGEAQGTRLYQNEGTFNHWLQLELVGRQSNRDAIGARIKVLAGELSMIREIISGSLLCNPDHTPTHFGLGSNQKANLIEIRWPSGIVQTFTDIPADQRITIDELSGILTVVRQVIPDSGHPDGGTAVQIQGESFLPGSKVLFGGIEAKNVHVETSTLITAVAPSGVKGFVDVEVINPNSSRGLLKNGFRYSTIQVTKITPDSGPTVGGIQIQIEGSGFQQGAVVKVGDNQLTNLFVTTVLIKGTLPAGISVTSDVSVINQDGETVVLKNAFIYIPPPTIDHVTYKGPLMFSAKARIWGSGFMRTPSVLIGGIASRSVTFISSDSLEVDIPQIPTIGPQDIVVINPDGQRVTLSGGLTIIAPPKIKSIEPTSGSLDGGTIITITGDSVVEYLNKTYPSNLKEILRVLVGEVECSEVTVKSDYVVTAITPPNTPGMKNITIIDSMDQDDTLENAFSYNNAPQITKIIPDNGKIAGGTQVTIVGNGFLPGAEVIVRMGEGFNVSALSTQVLSSTTITAIMPSGKPGDKDITIRNTDGQEITSQGIFTYNPMPTIARITPNYCASSGGSKIIIEGTGFILGARVIIGEKVTAAQVKDDMAIEVVAPSNRQGVYDVRIINPDTQEVVMPKGLISVGEKAYNYPNPFNASQGTTFRYVTQDSIQTMTVKIFNLAGIPIDIVHGTGSNEVRWQNDDTRSGAYIYIIEVKLSDNSNKNFKGVLEVSN